PVPPTGARYGERVSSVAMNRGSATDAPARIRVQKFGGTSVGDFDRIRKVATRIAHTVEQGEKVVVTVSAMGDTTDRLLNMGRQLAARPSRRELDVLLATGEQQSIALLALALQAQDVRARSFTGPQAGFLTDRSAERRVG